jgi:hypothetical protein
MANEMNAISKITFPLLLILIHDKQHLLPKSFGSFGIKILIAICSS